MAFDLSILLSSELHDVKNLMQVLSDGHIELAAQLEDKPDAKQQIDKMQLHIHNLNHRLVELLSILKLQNPEFSCTEDEFWLVDTLTPLVSEYKQLHDFDIVMEFDEDFNGFYDEQLMQIALRNIFTNAKAEGANQATISLEEFNDGHWHLNIKDNGPGFPSELLSQTEFHPQGAKDGLGLYLIQEAVGAHNRAGKCGKMRLSNHENGGAITQLAFP